MMARSRILKPEFWSDEKLALQEQIRAQFQIQGRRGSRMKTMTLAKYLKLNGGSAWESNPPGRVLAPHSGFEVRQNAKTTLFQPLDLRSDFP
jgi:hypothetical protein